MTARALALASVLTVTLGSAVAQAQGDGSGASAVELGREALDLYNQRRWIEAHDRFAQAERRAHSPVFLLYMARAKQRAGDLTDARALLERVVNEVLGDGVPDTWRRAQADARGELESLAALMPRLRVVVEGAATEVIYEVDGKVVDIGTSGIELNPGEHSVRVSAGGKTAEQTVTLHQGERDRSITLTLVGEEPTAAGGDVAASEGPLPDREKGSFVPGAVALAVGGAGLVVGAVTGSLAASKTSDIKKRCIGDSCLRSDAPAAEDARALATASTVSFVVGGVAAAAGVVLLIWRPGGSSGAEASLRLGPSGVSYQARF